jgi:hypothetical protein
LSAQPFDLFSTDPLPLVNSKSTNSPRPIVIAASMMYEADLAQALARRLAEAVHEWDAYVIVGDCDSGHREGGCDLFLAVLDELLPPHETHHVWTSVTVTNAKLKWQAKQVRLLLLNPPVQESGLP